MTGADERGMTSPSAIGRMAVVVQVIALIILAGWYLSNVPDAFVDLDVEGRRVVLTPYTSIIEDPFGELTINDVASSGFQDRFDESRLKSFALGITRSTWWIRIDLGEIFRKDPALRDRNWLLELARANLDYAELYQRNPSGEGYDRNVQDVTIEEKIFSYMTSIFPVRTGYTDDTVLYVKIRNLADIVGVIILWDKPQLIRKIAIEQALYGIFFGGVLILLFYNFCMYISMRKIVHIYYILYLMFTSSFITLDQGHLAGLFDHFDPLYVHYVVAVSAWLGWLFVFLFTYEFVDVPKKHKELSGIIKILCVLLMIGAVLVFFIEYTVVSHTLPVMTFLLIVVFTSGNIYLISKGDEEAIFLLFAWGINIVGIFIFSLTALGFLEPTVATEAAMPAGILLEALLMSFSLADKIKRAQKEVDKANQRAIALAQRYSQELEEKVRERTRDLEDSQQELVTKQQMAAMGVLTAGIVHEINNPNNFVSAGLQNLTAWKESFEELLTDLIDEESDPALRHMFSERFVELDTHIASVGSSSDNISTIVNGLRTITRLDEADMKDVDVVDGLLQIMRFMASGLGRGISFTSHAPDRPQVMCYPAELNNALMAVLMNAVQAIREREAATTGPFDGKIHAESHVVEERDERFLHITIADNGIGMTKRVLYRAFEPFFTTRAAGEGAALGLSITRDTLEKHGGTITLKTALNEGTTATIKLPVMHQSRK